MPAELEACVQDVLAKDPSLDEAKAYAICNEQLNAKVQSNNKQGNVKLYQDDGHLYLKAFLLDASININEWGVTQASLQRNINSFIGKPLVLTEDYSHPVPNNSDSLDHWLAYQETYRIGTIVDVVAKEDETRAIRTYYALIEITNEDAKRALQQGAIPNYVSPAIAQSLNDKEEAIENWTGVHLAIVDDPAFTVKKATITASCGGDSEQCLLQLRKAKVQKQGLACGFCNYQALTSKFSYSSHASSKSKFKTAKMVEDNIKDNPATALAPAPTQETVPKSQYDELVKKLADAELKAKELSETNKSISTQVAEIQLERRREKIERIVTAELIKDDKKRTEKVSSLVASSIPVQEIEDLYKDAFIVRKASVERATARPHVTLGSNSIESEDTREIGRKLAIAAGVL